MTFEIEKEIPIPPLRREDRKYPFADMDVGDSFFIRFSVEARKKNQSKIGAAIGGYSRRNSGKKFSARCVDGGIRVWRIA